MRISIHLLTCPGREKCLAATLTSWGRVGWLAEPEVYLNTDSRAEVPERVAAGFIHLFELALAGNGEFFLLLEDDLLFAPKFHTALARWPPLRSGEVGCGNLYNPGIEPVSGDAERRFVLASQWRVYGSQARIFSLECAEWLLPRFVMGAEHHDQQTARLVSARWPLHYHVPSLVQHTGRVSTWGGERHEAPDFAE